MMIEEEVLFIYSVSGWTQLTITINQGQPNAPAPLLSPTETHRGNSPLPSGNMVSPPESKPLCYGPQVPRTSYIPRTKAGTRHLASSPRRPRT